MLTQITPHPPEPFLSPDNGGTEEGAKTIEAEKLAYFAEASRMSTERSFVRLQANCGFVKISAAESRRNTPCDGSLSA